MVYNATFPSNVALKLSFHSLALRSIRFATCSVVFENTPENRDVGRCAETRTVGVPQEADSSQAARAVSGLVLADDHPYGRGRPIRGVDNAV